MKTILEEALEITDGSRQADYGDVRKSFINIAQIANMLIEPKGPDLEAKDICKIMMAVKLSREINVHKRDNLVDLCGYARLLSILESDEE